MAEQLPLPPLLLLPLLERLKGQPQPLVTRPPLHKREGCQPTPSTAARAGEGGPPSEGGAAGLAALSGLSVLGALDGLLPPLSALTGWSWASCLASLRLSASSASSLPCSSLPSRSSTWLVSWSSLTRRSSASTLVDASASCRARDMSWES